MWLYYRTVKLNSQLPSLDPGLEWPAWNCISVFLLGDARSVKCGQIILNNHCSSTWRKIMLILLSGAPFLHSILWGCQCPQFAFPTAKPTHPFWFFKAAAANLWTKRMVRVFSRANGIHLVPQANPRILELFEHLALYTSWTNYVLAFVWIWKRYLVN